MFALTCVTMVLWASATVPEPHIPADEARAAVKAVLSEEVMARLEAGEVVDFKRGETDEDGQMRASGRALVLIDAPPEDVWKHIADFSAYPEYMPHLMKIEAYRENGPLIGTRETLQIFVSNLTYHILRYHDEKAHVLSWTLDRSQKNDIEGTEGYWVLLPHGDGQTIGVYTISAETGVKALQALQDYFFNQDLPAVVEVVRKRVESGGAYKKPFVVQQEAGPRTAPRR